MIPTWTIWKPVRGPQASRFRVHKCVLFSAIFGGPLTFGGFSSGPASGCPACMFPYIYIHIYVYIYIHISFFKLCFRGVSFSGGSLHGGASVKVEKVHFCCIKQGSGETEKWSNIALPSVPPSGALYFLALQLLAAFGGGGQTVLGAHRIATTIRSVREAQSQSRRHCVTCC